MINKIRHPDENIISPTCLWQVPHQIMAFIANSIEDNSIQFNGDNDKPNNKLQNSHILPWFQFKQIIYDVYNHRIQYAFETNGVINTTYLNFEEYILIYFLDIYKERKQAEIKLIKLLITLRYYLEIWPRAKTFAQFLNIAKSVKVNNDPKKEHSLPKVDIYLQEFFLHAYSIIIREKDYFLESKDGATYIKVVHSENTTNLLMTWFVDQDSRKWFHRVRRNLKKIKTTPLDDFETDYIDIDVLLNMYMEEFKSKKKQNQKALSREFIKYQNELEGQYHTDEIDNIILSCMPSISQSVFVKFPGQITIRRALLYSLVCGNNGYDIDISEFIAGCNRFGLDNPWPIVTQRIALYGNEEDFEDAIKKEINRSNLEVQIKLHTGKDNKDASTIKIQQARLSSALIKPNEQMPDSRAVGVGITNMKLLGRNQIEQLEVNPNIIAGGIKVNIAQLGQEMTEGIFGPKKGVMTQVETSLGNKKIIIPSFTTTSALFSQHFNILCDLQKRIKGLKHAYFSMREEDRSWEQVEKILHVLETGCKFLDFPLEQKLQNN